uniref:Si:zfos-2372e4.1 n=1 Tax=Cyprinus carpio carpio TaxID=630221 RepID=A0A9J8C8H1_CYPCA
MSLLTSLMQLSILGIFLIQCVTSLPVLGRCLGEEDSISTTDIFSPRKMLFPRDDADMLFEDRDRRSGLHMRQLGDIEFTNRYAELLKSKAKITSICGFLKRMQSSKNSGVGGETDRLISVMRQYSCPNVYQ